jgi:predicted ATPase
MKSMSNTTLKSIGTPEAFYRLFRALSQNERFTAARYILEDEEIRYHLKIPNEITLEALSEDKNNMPIFNTIDDLREDLLK